MSADEIRAAAIKHGDCAIARSRHALGESAWREHGTWVEAYVIESAKAWAIAESRGGWP